MRWTKTAKPLQRTGSCQIAAIASHTTRKFGTQGRGTHFGCRRESCSQRSNPINSCVSKVLQKGPSWCTSGVPRTPYVLSESTVYAGLRFTTSTRANQWRHHQNTNWLNSNGNSRIWSVRKINPKPGRNRPPWISVLRHGKKADSAVYRK